MNFNVISKGIHADNVVRGWWDDSNQCIYEKLQLISTEVAEATEGERKDINDDHLPHRKMGEVELADALIRTLDLGGKLRLAHTCNYRNYDRFSQHSSIGLRHLLINRAIMKLADNLDSNDFYTGLINIIVKVSESLDYDIESAMNEKLDYNAKRLDHKRESRKLEHGKKF